MVSFLISVACTGEESINNAIPSGSGTVARVMNKESQLRESAFEYAVDFLNCNLYS